MNCTGKLFTRLLFRTQKKFENEFSVIIFPSEAKSRSLVSSGVFELFVLTLRRPILQNGMLFHQNIPSFRFLVRLLAAKYRSIFQLFQFLHFFQISLHFVIVCFLYRRNFQNTHKRNLLESRQPAPPPYAHQVLL